MHPFYFYSRHLEQVSRSFSFCISHLMSPAKEWVALSYLLLRSVDTIEDLNWNDNQRQYDAFEAFKLFLLKTPSKKTLIDWLALFPEQIPLDEKNLLMDLQFLLEDKNQLPNAIKQAITHTILQMIDGMSYFLRHYKINNKMIFTSLKTTNHYCFFVAGIVGKLLSQIFTYLITDFKWTPTLLNQSFHFGLFLQKINLLKDKMKDERVGHYYFFSGNQLHDGLISNAKHSLAYLKSIPVIEGRSYRLFCAWSLFIGLASLKRLDKNWQLQQQTYKIKPRETYYLVNQINQLIDDNRALEHLFNSYLPENIKKNDTQVETTEVYADYPQNQMPSWFSNIYTDNQSIVDWCGLGMIS